MKKLYVILGCLFLVVIFSSCKKEYIPIANDNQTILIPVQSLDWITNDYGVTYSVSLKVPEISYNFNQTGEVLVYISYGNDVYEQIPEVYSNTSFSFTHSPGMVTIYAQDIDHKSMIDPGNVTIKIVLAGSNY